jgi:hypothetical protein
MSGRADRRQEVDGRLDALESSVSRLDKITSGLKRKVDMAFKATNIICEGFPRVEALWQECAGEGVVPKLWRELKQRAPEAVCRDIADHLELPWPVPEADDNRNRLVRALHAHLPLPGVVANVYDQLKWDEASQSRLHKVGAFKIMLNFGIEALEIQPLLRGLDRYMRRASGLVVAGDDAEMPAAGEAAGPRTRRLIYLEKTHAEQQKGKGKGKGDDADKGAGKGKKGQKGQKGGRGGKGGKGRGRGKGGAPAAAAPPGAAA